MKKRLIVKYWLWLQNLLKVNSKSFRWFKREKRMSAKITLKKLVHTFQIFVDHFIFELLHFITWIWKPKIQFFERAFMLRVFLLFEAINISFIRTKSPFLVLVKKWRKSKQKIVGWDELCSSRFSHFLLSPFFLRLSH